MKDKLAKLLKTKEAARAALVTKSEKSENVEELRSIHEQLEGINAEIAEIRSMIADVEAAESDEDDDQEERTKVINGHESNEKKPPEQRNFTPNRGFNKLDGANFEDRSSEQQKEAEIRGKELKEGRSVTVSSSNILLQKVTANTINPTFNKVSGLLDRVDQLELPGGESFTQPYEIDSDSGDYTPEGGAYKVADSTFGNAAINKTKITAYSESTEEVEKLAAAPYESVVMKGITKQVRRKITKEILSGDGATGHLTGIFVSSVIDASTDLSIATIGNNTLDDIVFGYGGDEEVEEAATLILNKADLKAFSQLRSTTGEKLHNIITNGNTGTIDGIPFIINSAGCKAISNSKTTKDDYCMAYGVLTNYKLVAFSPLDVQKSTDFKFSTGQIAHRGSIFIGGNVVTFNGFVRVKKAATV